MRGNVYFNLVKLGATIVAYHEDFYGPLQDRLNAGEESDRVVLRWELASARAMQAADGRHPRAALGEGGVVLGERADGEPAIDDASSGDDRCSPGSRRTSSASARSDPESRARVAPRGARDGRPRARRRVSGRDDHARRLARPDADEDRVRSSCAASAAARRAVPDVVRHRAPSRRPARPRRRPPTPRAGASASRSASRSTRRSTSTARSDVIRAHLLPRLFAHGDVAAERRRGDPARRCAAIRWRRPRSRWRSSTPSCGRAATSFGEYLGAVRAEPSTAASRSGSTTTSAELLQHGRAATRRGLPAHQAEDRARARRRAGARGPRAVRRRPAPGRRERRLHRSTTRTGSRSSTRSTCCSIEQPLPEDDLLGHAELAKVVRTPICLDESITSARVGRGRDRPRRVQHRQHQGRARRRLPRGAARPRRLRERRRPGVVRRHARDRARPRRQRRARRAPGLHAAGRHVGLRPLLRGGHHRAVRARRRAARRSDRAGPRRLAAPRAARALTTRSRPIRPA